MKSVAWAVAAILSTVAVGQESAKPQDGAGRVAMMGGGPDLDDAFRWMCAKAGSGPFLVLRASGTDAYNSYIGGLCPALSAVETLILTSREQTGTPAVLAKIREAGAIFIAGGSQDNYVNFWQGTPVQDEINRAVTQRHIPVGGTSAGLAVLAQYSFAALHDTVHSKDALANPFDARVTIVSGFLTLPFLDNKITDSHFSARDRMGRLLVFLARSGADGIGIDERTAVLLEPDGVAHVVGRGHAYFLHPPKGPEVCKPGQALTFRDVAAYRLAAGGGRFDVAHWKGAGGAAYKISAVAGVLQTTQDGGQIY